MVSSSHETLHRIFQEDPGLFVRAVKGVGVTFADPVAAVPFPTDLTENRPVERRVDTLLRLETGDGARFLLAVESQGKPDSDKPASWAYYLSHLHAKYRLPPLLLVVCADRRTADWASRHVDIGPVQWPSLTVRPLVLGPDSLPVINSPDEAARDIPLTVLSAAVHRRDPDAGAILKALATALKDLSADDESTASKFIELTEQGLGTTPAANLWRQIMAADLSFFQSQTAQNLRAEGRAVGRAEAILLLLGDRGVEVSEEARERILGCQDLEVLDLWVRRAVTAVSVAEVFGGPEG
ncbi:hypothetical protein M4J06_003336 [Streptomyces coelicoflavus]|uniref:hypothetical protein n=1 Tax=Streptomyces coelicoflavus TaxID=285562 RepID=UPI00210A52A8|nr:hypothetical protein [Streptomyces coelicoflavus]MCQ4204963.1 hypothetical protein [Streptomyces coelicoflavus]